MTKPSHSRVSQQKTMTWRSGVPVDRIEEGESDRLMHLEEILSKRIVGWESQKGLPSGKMTVINLLVGHPNGGLARKILPKCH